MKSKPQKLEKGTFDDQLRYLLKKYSGLELRKAITTLCEEEVRRARIAAYNDLKAKIPDYDSYEYSNLAEVLEELDK